MESTQNTVSTYNAQAHDEHKSHDAIHRHTRDILYGWILYILLEKPEVW